MRNPGAPLDPIPDQEAIRRDWRKQSGRFLCRTPGGGGDTIHAVPLWPDEIDQIRDWRRRGMPHQTIAAHYHVTPATVRDIEALAGMV